MSVQAFNANTEPGSQLFPAAKPVASSKGAGLYIPSLDGIRAVSFMIVFLAHAGLEKWVPGYLGLTVFFFLSGYLITTLLRIEADQRGRINFSYFYVRRALRIFPPFYVVLGLALILTVLGVLPGPTHLDGWPFQALHLTNYYIIRSGWWEGIAPGTWVYWSLAVEEHFYLVFPFLFLLLRRNGISARQQAWYLLAGCGLVLAWRCWLVFGLQASHDRMYVATDTRIDSILFGCVLALWGNPALDDDRISERQWKQILLPAGLGLLLLSVVVRQPQYDQTLRYTLQGIALLPLFTVAIRYPSWGAVRLLNHPFARWLGVLSYSLYLLHTAVIYGVQQWVHWSPFFQGLLALGICLVLAIGIRTVVEEPCGRLRKQFSSGKSPREEPKEPAGTRSGMLAPVPQDGGPLA